MVLWQLKSKEKRKGQPYLTPQYHDDKEEKKVTCSELSAVKTALEQAADAATNFKQIKILTYQLEKPHCDSYHFVYALEEVLKQLENDEISKTKMARLRSYKKMP